MDQSPAPDLVGMSPGGLASSRQSPEPDPTDFLAQAEPAAASDEVVVSEIEIGSRLPSSEVQISTPPNESHAVEADPEHGICETAQVASALLLMSHAQPPESPVAQESIDQQMSASSSKQEVESAQLSQRYDSNEADTETGSVQSEHSSHGEPHHRSRTSMTCPSSPCVNPDSKDLDGSVDATMIEQGTSASSLDACDRCGDRTDGADDLDPIQDGRPATPRSDHHETGCETLDADNTDRGGPAALPPVSSNKVDLDLGTRSPDEQVPQQTLALSDEEPCSGSVSDAAEPSHVQRGRTKRSAFKSPLPLMEAASSALSSLSKRKRSLSSTEGLTIADPICVDDCEDKSPCLTRPADDRSYASQASPKPSVPKNIAGPRPKRLRGQKPNYIQYTNLEIFSRFEILEREWSQARSEMEVYREAHHSFLEYIQGLGYDG
ncbi:MAG: hypothetical protein Q9213_001789 [Squamulea squamosa]